MRMYVQLDVEWPGNRKRIRAGLEASAIHAICLCLAKRSSRDGWVAKDELGLYGATDEHLDRLIDLALLDVDGEWVRPHDWLEVNLSSDRIRAEKADKARAANHARWHSGSYETCEKCQEKARSSEADPSGLQPDPSGSLTGSEPDTEQQQQQPKATDADGRRTVLVAAAAIIGEKAGARPNSQNPAKVAAAVKRGIIADRYQDAYALLAANPTMTPAELAEALEPEDVQKIDGRQVAQDVMADRNRQRLNGTACQLCDGSGMYLDDKGLASRCGCVERQLAGFASRAETPEKAK